MSKYKLIDYGELDQLFKLIAMDTHALATMLHAYQEDEDRRSKCKLSSIDSLEMHKEKAYRISQETHRRVEAFKQKILLDQATIEINEGDWENEFFIYDELNERQKEYFDGFNHKVLTEIYLNWWCDDEGEPNEEEQFTWSLDPINDSDMKYYREDKVKSLLAKTRAAAYEEGRKYGTRQCAEWTRQINEGG